MTNVLAIVNKYKVYLNAFETKTEDNVVLISYINIHKQYRNKGIGTLFFRELIQAIKVSNANLVVYPASANTRLYNRLIKFYTNLNLHKRIDDEGFIYFTTKSKTDDKVKNTIL